MSEDDESVTLETSLEEKHKRRASVPASLASETEQQRATASTKIAPPVDLVVELP